MIKKVAGNAIFSLLILSLPANTSFAGPDSSVDTSNTNAPSVHIVSPRDGFITNQSPISVTVTYRNIDTLTINGNQVNVIPGSNSITVTLSLSEGLNRITAVGRRGPRESTHHIGVALDTIPPELHVINPEENFLTNHPQMTVIGTHNGASEVSVNNVQADVYQGGDVQNQKNPPANQSGFQSVHAGNTAGNWDHAQGFTPSVNGKLSGIDLHLAKAGNPAGEMSIEIESDGLTDFPDQSVDPSTFNDSVGLKSDPTQARLAQSFIPSATGDLNSASLLINKAAGSPNGNLSLGIHNAIDDPQNFSDASDESYPITANGDVQADTTQSKFGGASAHLDGNSDYLSLPDSPSWQLGGSGGSAKFDGDGDYLSIPYSSDWQLGGGTGDFTIDTWVRFADLTFHPLMQQFEGLGPERFWAFYWNNSGSNLVFETTGGIGGDIFSIGKPWSPSVNTWYHVAVVRNRNVLTLYVDGVSIGSNAISGAVGNFAADLTIGAFTTSYIYNGWMDEIRISNVARWTSNFTPPVQEYTSDQNTKLLLHLNHDFADSSSVNHSITSNGNVSIDHSNFRFQGDFTIDFWFFWSSYNTTYPRILGQFADDDNHWNIYVNTSNQIGVQWYANGVAQIDKGSEIDVISTERWYHIAVVRSGTSLLLFIDGVWHAWTASGPEIGTNSLADIAAPLFIGKHHAGGNPTYFAGYIDELRISNTARWTQNFTPPDSEYSSDEHTKLLLHANMNYKPNDAIVQNGISNPISEASLENGLEDLGHAERIVTPNGGVSFNHSDSVFGGASASFNGTNSYLSVPDSPDWQLGGGNGDFTIDTWIYFNDVNPVQTIASQSIDGTHEWNFFWRGSTNNDFCFQVWNTSGVMNLFFPSTLNTHQWYHLELVRSESNISLYINGNLIATRINSGTIPDFNASLTIGAGKDENDSDPFYLFHGLIDEFRISNIARHTQNFSLPTSEYVTDQNTKLLLHLNDSYLDSGNTVHEVTWHDQAHIDSNESKLGNASAAFDGDGDSMSIPDSSDWQLGGGAGNFTIDLWVRFNVVGDCVFIGQEPNANLKLFLQYSAGSLLFSVDDAAGFAFSATGLWTPVAGTWYHVAIIRGWGGNANDYALTINGSQIGTTTTQTGTIPDLAAKLIIGAHVREDTSAFSLGFNGWMDELRISNIARWTTDHFTPPDSEYSSDEHTKLLLHFNVPTDLTEFSFPVKPALTEGNKYFLVLNSTRSQDPGNYISWARTNHHSNYTRGESSIGNDENPIHWMIHESQDFIFNTNLHSNRSGVPSNHPIPNGVSDLVSESTLSGSFNSVHFSFPERPELSAGTSYHIVLKTNRGRDPQNYVKWASSGDTYSGGSRSVNSESSPSVWTNANPAGDLIFDVNMHPEGVLFTDQTYASSNQNVSSILHHDGTDGAWDQAQGFTPAFDEKLKEAALYLKKTGNPQGEMRIEIRGDSEGVPSNQILENGISNPISESTVSNLYQNINFSFSNPPALLKSHRYHFVLTTTRAMDTANYIEWGSDNTEPSYQGGARSSNSRANPNQWSPIPSNDFIFSTQVLYEGPSFTARNVPLIEGPNELRIIARDLATNETTVLRHGVLDTIPPNVVVNAPAENFVTNQDHISVSGTYSDAESITVNGQPAGMNNGTFSAENISLSEGQNTITIVAVDHAGNPTTVLHHGILDTVPPVITLTSPTGNFVGRQVLTIEGHAEDSVRVTSVTVNGESADVNPQSGNFSKQVTLSEGLNPFSMIAQDEAGNSNSNNPFVFQLFYQPGDVNEDGVVNLQDGQKLVNQLIGVTPFFPSADLNHDGYVNNQDYEMMINIYLNP